MPDDTRALIELASKVTALEERVAKVEGRAVNWVESAEHAVKNSPKLSMAFSLFIGLATAWAMGKTNPAPEPRPVEVKELKSPPFSPKELK